MGSLQEFLMGDEVVIDRNPVAVDIKPFPSPFLIHAITEEENQIIRKSCQSVTFDKRTRQKRVEVDQDAYNKKLVTACCADPNFKDAGFQEKFGVRGEEELIGRLLKPGQFIELLLAVQDVNGFSGGMEELVDEAKN